MLHLDYIEKMIGLQGIIVKNYEKDDNKIQIDIEMPPKKCPRRNANVLSAVTGQTKYTITGCKP